MGKTIDELRPSDKVMVEFGARNQYDEDTGELKVMEAAKQRDVPYSYFQEITKHEEEYNLTNGFYKPLARTVVMLGTVEYTDSKADSEQTMQIPTVVPFETEAGRLLAKQIAEAQAKEEADRIAKQEIADKKAADEAAKKAQKDQEIADKKAADEAAKLAAQQSA